MVNHRLEFIQQAHKVLFLCIFFSSPFISSASYGFFETKKALSYIEQGQYLNARNCLESSNNPQEKAEKVFKKILEKITDKNASNYIRFGIDIAKFYPKIDINIKSSKEKHSLLGYAILWSSIQHVEEILTIDRLKLTSEHFNLVLSGTNNKSFELIKEHHEFKLFLNLKSASNPFKLAIKLDNYEAFLCLKDSVNIEILNEGLIVAIQSGQLRILKSLLKIPNIDVNYTKNGMTGLMIAAKEGLELCVEELLKHPQIEINRLSDERLIAVDYAIELRYGNDSWYGIPMSILRTTTNIIKMLRDKQSSDTFKINFPQIFSRAIDAYDYDMISFLIETPEFDINSTGGSRLTPFDLMIHNYKKQSFFLLPAFLQRKDLVISQKQLNILILRIYGDIYFTLENLGFSKSDLSQHKIIDASLYDKLDENPSYDINQKSNQALKRLTSQDNNYSELKKRYRNVKERETYDAIFERLKELVAEKVHKD